MIEHIDISDSELRNKIRRKDILLAGNRKLKIYGTFSCTSGKRMKRENRIFFSSESEAIDNA
ncbi:metal-binding protein [Elizabethkingia anophelis]|nr:metal-binding protein [Elizabethkingia anophelis]